jgi:hypothetical protein
MSFGFSISDFITVIELANKIRTEFIGAPSQLKDISNEYVNCIYGSLFADNFTESEAFPSFFKMPESSHPGTSSMNNRRRTFRRLRAAAIRSSSIWKRCSTNTTTCRPTAGTLARG